MKIIILFFIFSLVAFTQTLTEEDKKKERAKMDDGDKQLLQRDACRKPMEALETKYEHVQKEKLEKIKDTCPY